ncbi:hypothetical protein [Streptomyces sp. S186]|uniref:hypothetical protein n=1 Tax=Streptomyces sp. S186 TaxID=3434395 RepID=UPI003F678A13
MDFEIQAAGSRGGRRLYDRGVLAPARTARTWLAMHWHRRRTRHQTRARHYRTRTARANSL